MKSVSDVRAALVEFVRSDLVGPAHGKDETIEEPPYVKYSAGVLFPRDSSLDESGSIRGVDAVDGEPSEVDSSQEDGTIEEPPSRDETDGEGGEGETYDDVITLANQYKPSAIGLTFAAPKSVRALSLSVSAAEYASETQPAADGQRQRRAWKRTELNLSPLVVPLPQASNVEHHPVADGLTICFLVSDESDRRIISASLYNNTHAGDRSARTFYQVKFSVRCAEAASELVAYADPTASIAGDLEELSLEMMYRKRRSFAVGHGCAADWAEGEGGGAVFVQTESIPAVVVPPTEPRAGDLSYLNMEFLQGGSSNPRKDIPRELDKLCGDYEAWIAAKVVEASEELDAKYTAVAASNLELCRCAAKRMRRGVEVIANDEVATEAFMLANRAMLMQQQHARLPTRKIDGDPVELPANYESSWAKRQGYWRTFQLAFILIVLPGLVDDSDRISLDNDEIGTRELVDLIWFPTGGGKTEAYLGLSAFLIFLLRLREPRSAGCKVLMRYTLRLLTSQQFQRAASLICACELIRTENPEKLGAERISIGLWVGKSLTPNDEKSAQSAVTNLMKKGEESKNPFQLLTCPWCGTSLSDKRKLGYLIYQNRQRFVCPNSGSGREACPFSSPKNALPVCVVDDSIYDEPPTLLIGTVDKFAILAWRQRAGQIFHKGGGPELIIQDELHLISGPLGSMVGLYESVIDFLSTDAKRPKIIASTATIRRAREQCHNLYARPMFQFPSPGLDASDSYFAMENPQSPGRLYMGFLPTAASSSLTAQIRSVVALQQGLFLLDGSFPEEFIDPYFTLIQYFGSLKELGRAATFLRADIPEFLPTMHRRYGLSKDDKPDRRRYMHTSEELTSRRNEDEIPKILARLEQRYSGEGRYETQALDTVLATNMISVGVDVDRLGLMMVVTQPKGTSEYIQASSRVGRSRNAPGLVLTLYNAGRPRDRSHYEQFRPYHDAFYRYVEPTSVTPFSPPALERALHAVLIIAGRHIAGWTSPQEFDEADEEFLGFISFLRDRVAIIDPEHAIEFENVLKRRLNEWRCTGAEVWGDIAHHSDKVVLMRPAGRLTDETSSECWAVPTSMRNVDVECGAAIVRYPG